MDFYKLKFIDSNHQVVKYDGSPVSWRVSAYSVIIQNDKVFLINSEDENYYDVPGGGVEIGEPVLEAVKREAMEEAGLLVKPKRLINYHQDYFYHWKEKKFYQSMLLYFESEILERKKSPTEKNIIFADFVEINQLDNYKLMPYTKEIILNQKSI